MHEGALTPRNKEEEEYEYNEDNNDKIIVYIDKGTYDYTLGDQLMKL